MRDESDVWDARRLGLPVYPITSHLLSSLGCPTTLPLFVVLAREISCATDTQHRRIEMADPHAVQAFRIEDLVVALLRVDALLARKVAMRYRGILDPSRLCRRILAEGVVREATRVGLQEVAPDLPREGPSLPSESLLRQDRDGLVVGVRA